MDHTDFPGDLPRSTRRARRMRMVPLAALMVLTVTLFSVLVPIHATYYGTPVPVAIPLGAALCSAPLIALSRPRAAAVVFGVAALVLPLVTSASRDLSWPWPWSVPAMITFTVFVLVITTVHGWRIGLVSWAAPMAASLALPMIVPAVPASTAGPNLIVTASITGATLLVAVLLAGRIRVGEELNRERELTASEQARRILVEERTRIARELHDVVAHSTSLIQVQASTARYRIPDLAPEATAEFEEISQTARNSLTEMRRLLGVLRTEDDATELAPQQSIADIPALVEGIRRTGGEVEFSFSPPPDGLPPSLHIAAFRITQEALSNAVRHAPGAPIDLSVGTEGSAVALRVHNDEVAEGDATQPGARRSPSIASFDGTVAATSGSGHGLRGMQERVSLLGGSLVVGPDPSGGWTVSAVLPFDDRDGRPE
ncbi:sensor histidine kinase [Brachybacterium sp. GCM10030268]|uniref:sensor histidine kinase n=1 Tax=Brachybacterium sp. GCM10030268 TaxID=3273382 RepID=UPI00361A62C7